MAFARRFQEGSVWVIDLMIGPTEFCDFKEDFAGDGGLFEDGIGQFG